MSGNPPPIIVRTSASSTNANTSAQGVAAHPPIRPSIVHHQPRPQYESSPAMPFKSVIVKPYRDSIQQALAPTTTPTATSADIKPIILQASNNPDAQQSNKRLALDSTNSNIIFSAVPKVEVLASQTASVTTNFPMLRVVTPSTFVNSADISTIPKSSQQVLIQQRGNVLITQPLVAFQVHKDSAAAQKENSLNPASSSTEQSATGSRTAIADSVPVQYQRKPCNCTKSMCLKLYCDCFANGLNCQNCACLNCHNDTRHDDERKKAIAATLERNPNAFKSKMYKFANATVAQPDRPLKGCNCKKSSCHKRYCECYESRVPCTSLCKCIGCKNTEQSTHPLNLGFYQSGQSKTITKTPLDQIPRTGPPVESTLSNNVFNMEVTEALASCLLVTGQQCEANQMSDLDSQETILREFQRCMHQIVQSALGRTTSSSSLS